MTNAIEETFRAKREFIADDRTMIIGDPRRCIISNYRMACAEVKDDARDAIPEGP